MQKIEKGAYKESYKGVTFYVAYLKDVEGQLKWCISYDDQAINDLIFYESGNDQLWITKTEACFMAIHFLKYHDQNILISSRK